MTTYDVGLVLLIVGFLGTFYLTILEILYYLAIAGGVVKWSLGQYIVVNVVIAVPSFVAGVMMVAGAYMAGISPLAFL